MLPAAFLALPRRGTLNIHPSLLPLYRGAAPVQRALQVGFLGWGCFAFLVWL
jgi:methionyl-tRNA formyltransferase